MSLSYFFRNNRKRVHVNSGKTEETKLALVKRRKVTERNGTKNLTKNTSKTVLLIILTIMTKWHLK